MRTIHFTDGSTKEVAPTVVEDIYKMLDSVVTLPKFCTIWDNGNILLIVNTHEITYID